MGKKVFKSCKGKERVLQCM